MVHDKLLARIDDRLRALGLSERKASLKAGLKVDAIRVIRRGHHPRVDTLVALAGALGVPAAYLLEAAAGTPLDQAKGAPIALEPVLVRGAVQAGVWRDGTEWDGDDWYAVTVPADRRFPGIDRFALEVRGQSMNRHYPDGTIVICVRYGDIGRGPDEGERVVCLRRSRQTGEFEATIKEYRRDDKGRHVLWPRSSDPEFQQPIVLPGDTVPVGGADDLPTVVTAGHAAGEPDLIISALVTQSVRLE